jgi:DNA/RNA-binding domain of Phe-tRNA-synthetase-like protein
MCPIMRIAVDPTVFETFPGYRRGIVVARGVVNLNADAELDARLRLAERSVVERFADADWRVDPRLAVWLETFGRLGVPVGSKPPSVAALVKRVAKGASLPFINQLVALMNITSLENLVPCGGDDLDTVGGEIVLRPATGSETYRPLGKPEAVEHPDPGELALIDTANAVVLCRWWCWRNSDVTKLTERTTAVALNVDLMSPAVTVEEGTAMTRRLADDLDRYCGGDVAWHILNAEQPEIRV